MSLSVRLRVHFWTWLLKKLCTDVNDIVRIYNSMDRKANSDFLVDCRFLFRCFCDHVGYIFVYSFTSYNFVVDIATGIGKLPLLNLSQSENQHKFDLQRRIVAPIHVKFGTTERHLGPLCHAKFHANRCTGLSTRPQKFKKKYFLVNSCPAVANPLTDFYKREGLLCDQLPSLVFYIWHDLLHWLRSSCRETERLSFSPNFSVLCTL